MGLARRLAVHSVHVFPALFTVTYTNKQSLAESNLGHFHLQLFLGQSLYVHTHTVGVVSQLFWSQ